MSCLPLAERASNAGACPREDREWCGWGGLQGGVPGTSPAGLIDVLRHSTQGQHVAVKKFYSGLDVKSDSSEQLAEFSKEVSVLSKLTHVNIIKYLGIGREW